MNELAALAAALAAALVFRAPAGRAAAGRRPPAWLLVGAAGAALLGVGVLAPGSAVLAALAAGVVAGVMALVGRRSRHRTYAATSTRVMETCELLAGELTAGQPPGRALDHAAASWPPLRPVAEAFGLGGDVPSALRAVATRPGAGDLRVLAAAWAVAHRTGHGLADAVQRCADSIRSGQATRRLVEGELSSARATVRLVAGLPIIALLMGSGAGGDPVGFLLGEPLGLACLAGGLVFGFAGLWWIEAIAGDVDNVS